MARQINRSKATPFHCIGKVMVTLTKRERNLAIDALRSWPRYDGPANKLSAAALLAIKLRKARVI